MSQVTEKRSDLVICGFERREAVCKIFFESTCEIIKLVHPGNA